MEFNQKFSKEDFVQMLKLLERYVMTEMDQWELWTFDTPLQKIHIEISMQSSGPDSADNNLNHLLKTQMATHNRFVEWTRNGGQHGRHSSMLSAPLRPIHGQC